MTMKTDISRPDPRKGFTLFEVMVSVALFAVLGTVCLENHLLNLAAIRAVKEEERCLLAAQSQSAAFELAEGDIPSSGFCAAPYEDCEYELSLSDLTLSETAGGESAIELDLEVTQMKVTFGRSSLTIPVGMKKAPE